MLEPDIFAAGSHPLKSAAARAGHRVVQWNDEWWNTPQLPTYESPVVFHGSLGNAARVAELATWRPGAFCNTAGFHCSAWYPRAAPWLVHQLHVLSTVSEFAGNPLGVAGHLAPRDGPGNPSGLAGHLAGSEGNIFVRPDSPLKPFSGRVVSVQRFTPSAVDYGFYFDDLALPIVLTPTVSLGDEYRFVVVQRSVVTGCRYQAQGRKAAGTDVPPAVASLAEQIAHAFDAPDPVYVLDLVDTADGPRLLEINPFSGADLYDCDLFAVVDSVAAIAQSS